MAITRQALYQAMFDWCVQWCYHGIPPGHSADHALRAFCGGHDVPQEDQIPPQPATYFAQNHQQALQDLQARLNHIGFLTDVSAANVAATKAHNLHECRAWAGGREHHIEEIYGLLTDLGNWQPQFRGNKSVLNTMKIVRMLSRQVI